MAKEKSVKINAMYSFMRAALKLIFPLITFPYASRILSPEGIGQVNFSNSIVSYFNLFALLGIETYAERETARIKDDKIALSKFVKEMLIINLISMLFAYSMFFITILFVPKFQAYRTILLICSTKILFNVIGINWFFYGIEEFKYTTIRSFFVQCAAIAFLFISVHSKEDVWLYAIYGVILSTGYDICNIIYARHFIDLRVKVKLEIKKHIKYIFTFFGMTLVTSIYEMLDTTMIGILSNDEQTGYYAAGIKINNIVLGLLSAVTAVILPRLSYYKGNGESEKFEKLKDSIIEIIILLSIPLTFGFIALSRPIILLVCGELYEPAIPIMQIISPVIFFISISNLAGAKLLPAMNKEKVSLASYIAGAVVNVTSNLIFIPRFNAMGAALGTILAESTVMLVQVIFLRKDFFRKTIIINFLHSLIASSIMFITIIFVLKIIHGTILQCITGFISGSLIYLLVLLLFRNKTILKYLQLFSKLFNKFIKKE
ncbi:flippase [Treponema bryantii]|uniref:flippase n=1 Tax=Treponema bryantii TaxID=163 RepID=UPI0003B345BA|nr:flippase [Treponema bryantii]